MGGLTAPGVVYSHRAGVPKGGELNGAQPCVCLTGGSVSQVGGRTTRVCLTGGSVSQIGGRTAGVCLTRGSVLTGWRAAVTTARHWP